MQCTYLNCQLYLLSILATWPRLLSAPNCHARLGPLWKLTFLSNKHKWERRGCVYVVLKIAGFKSQCKPRAFLCIKLYLRDAKHNICKGSLLALYLSGAKGWPHGPGAQYYMTHHKLPFLSLNISLLLILLKCGDSKTIPYFPSLGFFSHKSTESFPIILVTVESYSFLFFC